MITSLLSLGEHRLGVWSGDCPLSAHLESVLRSSQAEAGDVLLSWVGRGVTLDAVEDAFLVGESVIRRTPEVTDAYRCGLGDRLLDAVGAPPAHHTQVRRFSLAGAPILQVAAYPRPPATHGVRLWCDPALVWLFVEDANVARVHDLLRALQPSWERLRVHHGPPLDRPQRPDLAARYPVEDPLRPVTADERADLCAAVEMLVGQKCVQALVEGRLSPRRAVDSTLEARRDLVRHLDRLDKVLEHSHGRAETKVALLQESLEALLPMCSAEAVEHLLAPHRHLVAGLVETHQHVAAAVAGASTTTALMSSAAVGRLLDRSDANRTATTAVAVAAFVIAVVTGFTALASVPHDDRVVDDLVRLAGWVGVGSAVLVAVAYGLARVAALPANSVPAILRRGAAACTFTGGSAVVVCFATGAVTGRLWALVAGGLVAVVTAFVRAWTDDY